MKTVSFQIVLTPEPEGGFTVTAPSLPGCVTYGDTLEQAQAMAKDAIKGYLESMQKHHEDIPEDKGSLFAKAVTPKVT